MDRLSIGTPRIATLFFRDVEAHLLSVIADWMVAIMGRFFLTQNGNTARVDRPDDGSDDRN